MVIHKNSKSKTFIANSESSALSSKLALGSFGVFLAATVLSGVALINSSASATGNTSQVDTVSLTVKAACTIDSTVDSEHSAVLIPGNREEPIGTTSVTVTCNDPNGYAVYAVGASSDNDTTKTQLIGSVKNIDTHDRSDSYTDASHWYMKLTSGDTGASATIVDKYKDYVAVPSSYTKVASASADTITATGTSFKTTYGIYTTTDQAADTYTGQVKYTVVNPRSATPTD